MIFAMSFLSMLIALGIIIYRKKTGQPFSGKEIKVVMLIELMAMVLCGKNMLDSEVNFDGRIERPAYGQGEEETELVAEGDKFKERMVLCLSERNPSEEEIEEYFRLAEAEIDESLKGDNPDLMHVSNDLKPQSSYAGGMVDAEWYFEDGSYVSSDGSICAGPIQEEISIYAQAILHCHKKQELYEVPITLVPPNIATKRGWKQRVEELLSEGDDPDQAEYILPTEVDGKELNWKKAVDPSGFYLSLLGIAAAIGLIFSRKNDKRREREKYQDALMKEYPRILNMLCLYVTAGVTVRKAMQRMVMDYEREKEKEKKAGMELFYKAVRELDSGVNEMEVYRRIGERSGNRQYRKLSLLLMQDLKKGTGNLPLQLEQEAEEAYEEEKMHLRAEGEKLSTKLLLPMMGLLGVVLILMIYPAMSGIGL